MKNMNKFKIFLTVMILVLLTGGILISPWFNAVSTEVIGLSRLNEAEVRDLINLNENVNMFTFDSRSTKEKLIENTYVENVNIVKNYKAKTIQIYITERVLSGYVQYPGGIYLYIDKNGYVLESATSYIDKLPLVVGLNVGEFTIGKFLNAESETSFQTVVTLARLFNEYELESDVIKVDVTDSSNIHLYIDKVDVEFGDLSNHSDTDEKIRTLKAILPHLPDTNSILDIKDISKPARFRLLT